jgi:hypothetical protein
MSTIRTDPDGKRYVDGGWLHGPDSRQAVQERLAKREAECGAEIFRRERRRRLRERLDEQRSLPSYAAPGDSRDAAQSGLGTVLRGMLIAVTSWTFTDRYGRLQRVEKGVTHVSKDSEAYQLRPSAFRPG